MIAAGARRPANLAKPVFLTGGGEPAPCAVIAR